MNILIIAFILFSHFIAARYFLVNLQKSKMPNTAHFATISVILYYDAGLVIETSGFFSGNEYFIPFFSATPWIVFLATIFLISAPWLFLLGSSITNKQNGQDITDSYSYLRKSTKFLFYAVIILLSIYFAVDGLSEVSQGDPIWVVRERIGKKWEALIVLLYLPLHFLAFYTRQSDSDTKIGLIFSWTLMLATILSTLGIGQRTNMLLPVLILVLFRKTISVNKIVSFLAIAIIAASALLPFFKWQQADSQDVGASMGALVTETIEADFYRGGVLVTALEKTEVIGTKIMPYPMSGYIYTLLYYVPRSTAPFKGWSTSQTFTAGIDKTPVEDTLWAFGVGTMEELLLNIGFFLTMPCLIIYGMGMGLLDKISARVPSLLIPTRLAAIWMCGYESSTLLLMFGTMAGVAYIFHSLFVQKSASIISNRVN